METGPTQSTKAIQGLLSEKERIEQWLERLQMAADETPGHVRERVEQDYRARLADVMTELHGHRDELEVAFERFAQERTQLTLEETAASEQLAEAELRHSVGEYDEEKWKELKTGILESLVKIRESLQGVEGEIAGLEGVLSLLRTSPAERTLPAVELAFDGGFVESQGPVSGEAGLPVPQTDAFDDGGVLALDPDEAQVPGASEARGEFQVAEDGSAPQSGKAVEADAVQASPLGTEPLDVGAQDAVRAVEGDGSVPVSSAAKTLTCVECGTPNLPTEWYCERCGAELDAV